MTDKSGIPVIDKNRCKGCGLCIAACPKKVLTKSEDTNIQGVTYAVYGNGPCIACQACVLMCPEAAVELDAREEAV